MTDPTPDIMIVAERINTLLEEEFGTDKSLQFCFGVVFDHDDQTYTVVYGGNARKHKQLVTTLEETAYAARTDLEDHKSRHKRRFNSLRRSDKG